ncbi:hypothetical protein EVAR_12107_1 [Eumeta japonica]|uniref:Reverse transcriptase domain-containing protein n=1 Tax=Eumeta variegata TaxID=151549 RepID=A0A4C1U6P7_EUMVA|nr:hypothetical protein EVAR_12107_1 [Eumeta japonica]
MSALTRQDVLSEQEYLRLHLSPLLYSAYTNDVPRPSSSGVQLALFADDTALFTEVGIGAPDSPSSLRGPLTSWSMVPEVEDRSKPRQISSHTHSRVTLDKNLHFRDPIETQCSHASPPHDIAHISRIEEEVLKNFPRTQRRSGSRLTQRSQTLVKSLNTRKAPGLDGIHKPETATSCQLQTDQPPERSGKLFEKFSKLALAITS